MTPLTERALIIMVSIIVVTLASLLALSPRAHAETGLPTPLCDEAGSHVFGDALGCGASSTAATLPFTAPRVDFSLSGDAANVQIVLPSIASSTATTTIEETFPIASPFPLPLATCKLTVIKKVVGGTASPSDFDIHVLLNGSDVSGSPKTGSASGSVFGNLFANTYTIQESGGPSGYTSSFSGDCTASGQVHLALDESAICTITNTFTASTSTPGNPGGGNPGGGASAPGGELSGTVISPSGGTLSGDVVSPSGGGGGGGGGGSSSGSSGGGSGGGGGSSSGGNPSDNGEVAGATFPGVPNTGGGGTAMPLLAFSAILGVAALYALSRYAAERDPHS